MSIAPAIRPGVASRWHVFEAWVGTRASAAALFALALAVFALQSLVLPAFPGRDMGRYVQAYVQYWYADPVYPAVLNTRGPLSVLGVSVPLELGGAAAEVWLALLYAASIVAWGAVAYVAGPRAAVFTAGALLVYPGYGILFHGLASDALFAAGFAGWALLVVRTTLGPSTARFLVSGAAMGALVLVRPSSQALIAFALLPLVLRVPWSRRLAWTAAFFAASVFVTQSWRALSYARHGDAVALKPSAAVLLTALALLAAAFVPLAIPVRLRRRAAALAAGTLVLVVAVAAWRAQSVTQYARSLIQSPPSEIFLFRAFEVERIVAPANGPESRELAQVVQRELLTKEPYRSYGVDLETFFSSGSDRIFGDMMGVAGGVDLSEVTQEAIRAHPVTFATGIAETIWDLLWARIYAPEVAPASDDGGSEQAGADAGVTVGRGQELPEPSEDQPIPASRIGPALYTLYGGAREVWTSPTDHRMVFDDPRDERRFRTYERDTARLVDRIPTRSATDDLVHRLNQASRAFPPPIVWLVVGALGIAIRRPRHALPMLAPALAGLLVIVATGMVAISVGEYALPVSPAFVVLAAAGLLGNEPRRRLGFGGGAAKGASS